MNSTAIKTRFAPGPIGLLHLENVRAALTADTHGPEMDEIQCLLGEGWVRRRFMAVAGERKGLHALG